MIISWQSHEVSWRWYENWVSYERGHESTGDFSPTTYIEGRSEAFFFFCKRHRLTSVIDSRTLCPVASDTSFIGTGWKTVYRIQVYTKLICHVLSVLLTRARLCCVTTGCFLCTRTWNDALSSSDDTRLCLRAFIGRRYDVIVHARVMCVCVCVMCVMCVCVRALFWQYLWVPWGARISLLVRVPDSCSKGCEFKSRQEWRENFLLQSQLCVLTLIWCPSPPPPIPVLPQWHVKDPGRSAKSAGGRLHLNTHTPLT